MGSWEFSGVVTNRPLRKWYPTWLFHVGLVSSFISIFKNGEHNALWAFFGGGGRWSSHAFLYYVRGPRRPIGNHPSPCALQLPKCHTYSVNKDQIKTPEKKMYDFIYCYGFYLQGCDGDGRKNPK